MINIPTECPCCDSRLKRIKDQLFCRNTECTTTNIKRIVNYCKKRKIKGLAEKSIEKLNLSSIVAIYSLDRETLIKALGKNGGKIYDEIQNSLNVTVSDLLGSLSIPLIGRTTAEKVEGGCLQELDYSGLPCKAKSNIEKWSTSPEAEALLKIPFKLIVPSVDQTNGTVCITGSFKGYNRSSLKELAEMKGYKVTTGVTSKTTLLLADKPSTSSKYKKAEELGINIIFNIEEL